MKYCVYHILLLWLYKSVYLFYNVVIAFVSAIQFNSSLVYRNCSELESPTLECGVNNADLVNKAHEDILGQIAKLVDLSEYNLEFELSGGSVCFCNEDQCNNQTSAKDFGGEEPGSSESLTTVAPGGE